MEVPRKFSTAVVIPAAGLSSRMGGRPKALRFLAGRSFLDHLVHAFQAAGQDRILVVCGHGAEEVEAAARDLGAVPIRNPDFRQGMFSSIKAGLKAVQQMFPEIPDVLICPVDAPLLQPRSVRILLDLRHRLSPDKAGILLPCFQGQAGHPALIPARHIGAVLASPEEGPEGGPAGLRGYYNRLLPGFSPAISMCPHKNPGLNFLHPEKTAAQENSPLLFIPLPDAGIAADLDTPEEALAAELFFQETEERALPSLSEARQLLSLSALSAGKVRHSILVGQGALRLALRLPASGMNLLLPAGAGLLHDILRQEHEHAVAAARLLAGLGWPETSFVAGCHARLPEEYFRRAGIVYPDRKFKTMEIPETGVRLADRLFYSALCVYLADKYTPKDRFGSIAERFEEIRQWFQDDPGALEGLSGRESAVTQLARWFADFSGCDPEKVVRTPSGHPQDRELERFFVNT